MEGDGDSRLRGPPGPPTELARVLGFAKQRHGFLGCNVVDVGPSMRSERCRTRPPRRAMHPCCDALGKRFAPTRPTGDGRSQPPFARPSGWLDQVDVRTPYHSHCGRRSCGLPQSARGTLPSSPRICWKLPGPGGLPALSSAAPLDSLRALAPRAEALTPVGTRHRIPNA